MPANYVLLNKQTLTASAASVVFSAIPQSGYTDLKIVMSARSTTGGGWNDIHITFNGSGTYKDIFTYGNSNSGASSSDTTQIISRGSAGNSSTASIFGSSEIYIPNYRSSNQKVVSITEVTENNSSATNSAIIHMAGGLFTGTQAITTVTLTNGSGSFVTNSSFAIYGLADVNTTAVFAPFATGGDIVTTDGTYWYHTFLSSGTFAPAKSLSCDVLTIAGGGGGSAGGGGAGGLVYSTANSLLATNYLATIGAGGAGRGSDINGVSGSNSQLGALTAAVGGGFGAGGSAGNETGGSGGSGGGAGAAQGGTLITASGGIGSQGFNGGALSSASRTGGGGAGAGQNGFAGTSNTGGVGGDGVNTYSNLASATGTGANSGYYAGGGGGTSTSTTTRAGGLGGGGAGGGDSSTEAVAGTANTGGGGGGSRTGTGGRAGGSGIIIIRYSVV